MTPICEMLSISESFELYYFALNFMFDLELHMRMKFRFIFSDCGIMESTLPQSDFRINGATYSEIIYIWTLKSARGFWCHIR